MLGVIFLHMNWSKQKNFSDVHSRSIGSVPYLAS